VKRSDSRRKTKREAARVARCASNSKQLMLSTHNFATSYEGQLAAANFYEVVNLQTDRAVRVFSSLRLCVRLSMGLRCRPLSLSFQSLDDRLPPRPLQDRVPHRDDEQLVGTARGVVAVLAVEDVVQLAPRRGDPDGEIALPVAPQPDRGRTEVGCRAGPSTTTSTFLRPRAQTWNSTTTPGTISAPTGRRRDWVASFICPCHRVIGRCRRVPRSEGTARAARESQRPRGIPDRVSPESG
jgi:hypothetical protein